VAALISLVAASPADARRSPGKIAYLDTGRLQQIRAVSGDGKVDRLLVRFDSALYYPFWSPNGRKLSYTRDSDDAILVRVPGRKAKVVYKGDEIPSGGLWSPNGRLLIFQTEVEQSGPIVVGPNDPGPPQVLVVIGSNGKGRREVPLSGVNPSSIGWARDSKHFLITRYDDPTHGTVWSVDLASGAETKVLDLPPDVNGIRFSPNGRWLAYSDFTALWVARSDASGRRKLTSRGKSAGNLTWRPDSGAVAFVRNSGGSSDIYKVNLSGRGFKRLTHSGHAGSPDWGRGTLHKRR
jgi:Tol biopolymer transport system component